jgi:hypothetical protein
MSIAKRDNTKCGRSMQWDRLDQLLHSRVMDFLVGREAMGTPQPRPVSISIYSRRFWGSHFAMSYGIFGKPHILSGAPQLEHRGSVTPAPEKLAINSPSKPSCFEVFSGLSW